MYNSQCVIGRTNVQRTFQIEDANTIIAHLPFIGNRIALPTTTAEEVIAIARKAGSSI